MVKQFTFWLEGIFEDDPLPDEIDTLVFNVRHNGAYKYVELKGYEKKFIANANFYYPLEAQFFGNKQLAKQSEGLFEYNVKLCIEECFASANLKQQCHNRNVYFSNGDKLEFLFKV
ncbi:MAG: hypothetical protein E7378_01230 [Clostridiales bacterium]|nr:hypothetical protein [Clostridiales bacterium]